jgi:NAD(P)-dependent dehydrogenase (short-subunit alcohol dehydrogenase family)
MDPRIVLVTGANTGLGYQIIRALCGSEEAYSILLGGRSLVKAQQAVKDAREEFPDSPSRLTPIQVDIESDDSIQNGFEEVKAKHGRLDALVNNAGTCGNWNEQSHLITTVQACSWTNNSPPAK